MQIDRDRGFALLWPDQQGAGEQVGLKPGRQRVGHRRIAAIGKLCRVELQRTGAPNPRPRVERCDVLPEPGIGHTEIVSHPQRPAYAISAAFPVEAAARGLPECLLQGLRIVGTVVTHSPE